MRSLVVWLGLATSILTPNLSRADNVLKPYVVFMLDTSGSMVNTPGAVTGSGPPSCGGADLRLNHARCAINKIVNSYGDMVFALGRFRETPGGTYATSCDADGDGQGADADQCTTSGVSCNNCNCNGRITNCTTDPDCTAALRGDARGEMLTGLVDGGNQAAATWTDFACGTCGGPGTPLANNPEIWGAGSWTPLGGFLASAARYWQGFELASDGTSVIWPSTSAGYNPIFNDPTKTAFLPTGCDPSPTCVSNCCTSQCRSYITIMLTDGDETCGGNAEPVAQSLLQTVVDNRVYRIETKVIGFGIAPGDADIEGYAHAGGAPDLPGVNEGYYANNEADLQLALSQILADAIKVERCNDLDDDCDTVVDEDFLPPKMVPGKGGTCSNGQLGVCARDGTLQCRADGTGLECNAPIVTPGTDGPLCNGLDDDCDGRIDEGLGCTPCVGTAESCNGLDDDCDNVPDQTCRCSNDNTIKCDAAADCGGNACTCTPIVRDCANTVPNVGSCPGTQQCIGANTWSACNGQTPTVESCDGLDNDCDGVCDGFTNDCSDLVTPGGPASDNPGDANHVPPVRPETGGRCADMIDNDGDGLVNDGCPAVGPAETACGGAVDDDSDGTVNDGCPGAATPLIQENICRPGVKTCPVLCGPSNSFGACSGEVRPCSCPPGDAACLAACTDPCNGIDDDCDNVIDEDFTPADCSNNCGVGQTVCTNGNISCNSQPTIGDPTCNNIDDDCDGMFDEDWTCANPIAGPPETACTGAVDDDVDGRVNDGCPATGAAEAGFDCLDAVDDDTDGLVNDGCPALECPCGSGLVCGGYEQCENGVVVCKGDPIGVETCNCLDDNCNNMVDEGQICPSGSSCVNCQCAFPCAAGEFPCPLGKKCEQGVCVNDPCFQVSCPPVNGNVQTCIPKPNFPNEPQCVDACSQLTCAAPLICFGPAGECRPNDCTTFPAMCTATEACVNGVCVSNPCAGVTCDAGTYCLGGACVSSCADLECPAGQRCRQGACETDPCGHACPFGQACNDATGQCIEDPCKFRNCPEGQWCNPNDGQCEDDPCVQNNVTCPNPGEVCRGGSCYDPVDLLPDAGESYTITVGGGGGCSTGGGGASALVMLALLLARRRRAPAARRGGVQ